jgi:hypothetical protein
MSSIDVYSCHAGGTLAMPCMHALEAAHHVLLVAVGNMPCACAGLLLVVQ